MLEPKQRNVDWNLIATSLGALIVAVYPFVRALWLVKHPCMPPPYYVGYQDPVSYTELIAAHRPIDCSYAWPVLLPLPILSLGLLIFSKKKWLILISIVIAGLGVCGGLFAGAADGTDLTPLDSVEVGGHLYYLSEGYTVAGGYDIYYSSLFLHECTLDSRGCYGYEFATDYAGRDLSLAVLEIREGHIQVALEGETIFVLGEDTD